MRRRTILIGTLALAVVVATIGGVVFVLHTAPYPGLYTPVFVVCPGPTSRTTDIGLPAIHPRIDCTPSFTHQDVRDYVAHGLRGLGMLRAQVVGRPTVTRVVFLTLGDLDRALGVLDARHTDMLVCYVGLRGTFLSSDGLALPGTPSTPSSTSAAFIAFDAHTGNSFAYGLSAPFG
jgi:hypothetical protein